MNLFSEWKSGNALQQALVPKEGPAVNNYGSIEEMIKGLLGVDYSKKEEKVNESSEELEAAQKRVQELSDATNKLTSLTSSIEKRLEELTEAEEDAEVPPVIEEEVMPATKAYRVFRDRDENFECKISIQGASLTAAQVRIIFDCDMWNVTFYGKLYKDGNCIVPIKRGIPLPEGTRGRARLEVIVDDQLFVPWEDDFVVEGSKKVKVELKGQKAVQVSFGKP
jgi:hypothetical protein